MSPLTHHRSTHAAHLERWLGREATERLSFAMLDWYGPPIAVAGVPGEVYAVGGGNFIGKIRAGGEASALDRFAELYQRFQRGLRVASRRQALGLQMNMALGSLSDIIAAAAAGKRREFTFQQIGATGVVGGSNSLWGVGTQPIAGANAAAAPGGTIPTDASAGAFLFDNPTGGDTQHFVSAFPTASLPNTLLLYDRLFAVNKTMASTATEAVTGVPTRYQNTVGGAADSAANFLFVEVGATALAATAHNWTTCLYTNQAGTGSRTLPSLTGNSGAIVRRLDHPLNQWFAPLGSGDTGIKELDQMQCSASVATGVINFVIGHQIAWFPCPIANICCVADGINTAFSMARIFDDAALTFLEVNKPATTATTYNGSFTTVAG